MIEIPEAYILSKQINETLAGKTITAVLAASSPHKFAWYEGDPAKYDAHLLKKTINSAQGYGMFVEISLSHSTLLFCDGVNLRLHPAAGPAPKKHQLLLGLNDQTSISASISMYGGIYCWVEGDEFNNFYYDTARSKPSPLSDEFDENYFQQILSAEDVQKSSLKAALATKQRIPGFGNGCLQDVLWKANLHPKRKTNTLSDAEIHQLYTSLKTTLAEMAHLGGRNTEKDLFGQPGGYPVVMSAANKEKPCPTCGTKIQKESYMGGSIYVCETCQPLV